MGMPGEIDGRHPGGLRPQRPSRDDPRIEEDGRRIFTEDDLDGYFRAVDPRLLARDRRRRHRRHGLVLGFVALVVAGLAVIAVQVLRGEWAIPGWEASPPREPVLCPAGPVGYAQDSTVTVFNGTTIGGLAGDVANALEGRGFTIGGVGNQGFSTSSMVAVIVSGPGGRETSLAVQRTIEGSVYLPDEREDATVDVIMGTKYTGLVPAGEISTEPGPLDCQRLETEAPPATTG
ncbi:MAG: LytR family transcriptional regulator [Citricoccus sp.]|nr:LytR family transcriptional regulator [Citricoccus sp. WCRC_4]